MPLGQLARPAGRMGDLIPLECTRMAASEIVRRRLGGIVRTERTVHVIPEAVAARIAGIGRIQNMPTGDRQ